MPTILIVDDDPAMRRMLDLIFQQDGFTVVTAANGLEALDSLPVRAREIDIVITDFMMPEMNGVALADNLKVQQPNLPVLILSACPEYLDIDSCSAKQILTKPFEVNALLNSVRRFLPKPVSLAAA